MTGPPLRSTLLGTSRGGPPSELGHDQLSAWDAAIRAEDARLRLLIGTGTVRTHLRRIFTKLDLGSRAELAALAVRRGL